MKKSINQASSKARGRQAEGRTDWKSEIIKVITTADVLFSTRNQVNRKKEGHRVRKCPMFHAISARNKVCISVSACGPYEMISP